MIACEEYLKHERLNKLINFLDRDIKGIPKSLADKRLLLRALMNLHFADDLPPEYFELQDEELQDQLKNNKITRLEEIRPSALDKRLRLWRGDITKLDVDAIVNAGNSKLLGCFHPMHNCIDNIIHSKAGLQLRRDCKKIMDLQGHDEPNGDAKITPAYNLPAKWVIHTVGPIISGSEPSPLQCQELADCYVSSLKLASGYKVKSIAFCSISTGLYKFPKEWAANIAVETVAKVIDSVNIESVIFDVFTDEDEMIYSKLLGYSHG